MPEHWATEELPGLLWDNEQPPTRHDLRQHEMWDLRGQGAGPTALWTATTITAPEYL